MTILEAIHAIENRLCDLNLKDKYDGSDLGYLAVSPVYCYHDKKWEKNNNLLISQHLTPLEYANNAIEMIDEFALYLFRKKIDKLLAS